MIGASISRTQYLIIAIVAVVSVGLVVGAFVGLKYWEDSQGQFEEQIDFGEEFVTYDGEDYVLKSNIETFLLIGLDTTSTDESLESYNNNKRADFLMLFIFDNDAKKYTAIHINRDAMTDMNVLGVAGNKVGTVNKQIALAHTYGNGKDASCQNTANAVSELFMGIKVNHYASITMDSVPVANDLVGGVELEVLDDFTGIDDSLVKGQTVLLKGEQALTYVRSRKELEDSSNSTRMERQQQYIKALYAAFNKCADADEDFIVDASLKMSEYIISDRSVTQMQALAEKFSDYTFAGVETLAGENVVGEEYMEFYPDKEAIEKMIIKLFYVPKE
jgi:LCP family protein required for cell wall assembly